MNVKPVLTIFMIDLLLTYREINSIVKMAGGITSLGVMMWA